MFTITIAQLESVKNDFALRGESVADWARLRNFNAATVYSILNGRLKCRRGEAHRIAVELGLKPPAQDFGSTDSERASESFSETQELPAIPGALEGKDM